MTSIGQSSPSVARVERSARAPTICLNMIVKNEAKVIARCLESVKPILDHWVIVDTGSTDGTQAIIRSILKDIPGELHERPWKDFGHNRTEAIELARGKADYLFVIDADDTLVIPPRYVLPQFVEGGVLRARRGRRDGVLADALLPFGPRLSLRRRPPRGPHVIDHLRPHGRLEGLVYKRTGGGARSADANKFRKDATVLEEALKHEPTNAR